MREALPLQTADIIAYESKKEFERRLYESNKEPRWGFSQLEKLISRLTPNESVSFGTDGCPISLFSIEELTNVSRAQKIAYDED